jgi:hypothetical protein
MSITILLAALLAGFGGLNMHLTSVSGGTAGPSPFGVIGGGPTTGPAPTASVDSVSGGGPTT